MLSLGAVMPGSYTASLETYAPCRLPIYYELTGFNPRKGLAYCDFGVATIKGFANNLTPNTQYNYTVKFSDQIQHYNYTTLFQPQFTFQVQKLANYSVRVKGYIKNPSLVLMTDLYYGPRVNTNKVKLPVANKFNFILTQLYALAWDFQLRAKELGDYRQYMYYSPVQTVLFLN